MQARPAQGGLNPRRTLRESVDRVVSTLGISCVAWISVGTDANLAGKNETTRGLIAAQEGRKWSHSVLA
jgi:hypothetical protein